MNSILNFIGGFKFNSRPSKITEPETKVETVVNPTDEKISYTEYWNQINSNTEDVIDSKIKKVLEQRAITQTDEIIHTNETIDYTKHWHQTNSQVEDHIQKKIRENLNHRASNAAGYYAKYMISNVKFGIEKKVEVGNYDHDNILFDVLGSEMHNNKFNHYSEKKFVHGLCAEYLEMIKTELEKNNITNFSIEGISKKITYFRYNDKTDKCSIYISPKSV